MIEFWWTVTLIGVVMTVTGLVLSGLHAVLKTDD